jgi:hypothetical protein
MRHIKKSRKPHTCVYCGRKTEPGEPCFQNVGKWQGEFQDWYLCDTCHTIYTELDLDWSEGISYLDEDMTAAVYDTDTVCPKCRNREFDIEISTKTPGIGFECDICGNIWTDDLYKVLGIKETGE